MIERNKIILNDLSQQVYTEVNSSIDYEYEETDIPIEKTINNDENILD